MQENVRMRNPRVIRAEQNPVVTRIGALPLDHPVRHHLDHLTLLPHMEVAGPLVVVVAVPTPLVSILEVVALPQEEVEDGALEVAALLLLLLPHLAAVVPRGSSSPFFSHNLSHKRNSF